MGVLENHVAKSEWLAALYPLSALGEGGEVSAKMTPTDSVRRDAMMWPFALLGMAHSGFRFETLDRRSCFVIYGKGQAVHMDCVVRSSMSQGLFTEKITLPDGKIIVIDGDLNSDKYTLNRRKVHKTGTDAHPCYDNNRMKICFD
jgi:hypothetical protein